MPAGEDSKGIRPSGDYLILATAVGAMAALWFSAIAGSGRHHVVARAAQRFSKEREQIRVKAEQQRIKDVSKTVIDVSEPVAALPGRKRKS